MEGNAGFLRSVLGESDNRNRRRVTIDQTIERLMLLDSVLADRSLTWLGSEREKRRYFQQRLSDGLRDDEYPRLVFGQSPNVTVRYFSDKLPNRLRPRSPPTRVPVSRPQSFADGLPRVRPAAPRAAQRLGFLDDSSPIPAVAREVDDGIRERRLRAPDEAIDTGGNRGVDLVLPTAGALTLGGFGLRSSPGAGGSKSVSQPAIRGSPPALDRGRKPCRLPGRVTRRSRYLGPSAGKRRVSRAAPCVRASLRACAQRRSQRVRKTGGMKLSG